MKDQSRFVALWNFFKGLGMLTGIGALIVYVIKQLLTPDNYEY